MNIRHLLLMDAIINLFLGILLGLFPEKVIGLLGLPLVSIPFYANILGGVLFGIGLALLLERSQTGSRFSGLGLDGAIAINLCGGAVLAFWLLFGSIDVPVHGKMIMWSLAVILFVISIFELAARRKSPEEFTIRGKVGPLSVKDNILHEINAMQPTDLKEHPEGGRFREVFRSAKIITTQDSRAKSALTHIYFSLKPGEISRFHKVASDEIWNLYKGSGLNLFTWDGTNANPSCITLSASENSFCYVIPAGMWQAATPISDEVLVGCSVAPGFEFSDFTLMAPDSEDAQTLISMNPEMSRYIRAE